MTLCWNFNPRSPHGERRPSACPAGSCAHHFNPRSPHGERRFPLLIVQSKDSISIHAPRTGSDFWLFQTLHEQSFQSTLPARGATDAAAVGGVLAQRFQSTLPARGATPPASPSIRTASFQSTLPARGATAMLCMINRQILFQSTLPARGATPILMLCLRHNQFQSTLPARGATTFGALKDMIENISIHAPRTGSDNGRVLEADALTIISIHAPRTGSDFRISQMGVHLAFQSTLPARGATFNFYGQQSYEYISIHAPRTGSDDVLATYWESLKISIHAPRTGSDTIATATADVNQGFQSTLPARGATSSYRV